MSFLAPAALWFSMVGLGIVALYLLKIKRRRQIVPSLDFWRQLVSDTQVRSLFHRLKRWLSLLLWLLAAACLVLALGNPIVTSGPMKAQTIAIIVDNSASMQVVEDESEGHNRLELARQAVKDLVSRRPVNDEWLVIEASHHPKVVQPFTRDGNELFAKLDTLTDRLGTADLPAAVALADQLLEGKDNPLILIVSDGGAGAVETLVKNDERILLWPIGQSDDNLGITRLSVRTLRQNAIHYVFIRVFNASRDEVETQLVFELDETTKKVEPLTVAPGKVWEKTISLESTEGGVLRVYLDRDDAFAADNEAFAILEPAEPVTVFLVTPADEAFFFEQALLAMQPLVDIETSQTLTPEQYDALGELRDKAGVTIFNNCAPKTWSGRGHAVFVNRHPESVPARSIGELSNIRMEITQTEHPLMRYLNFGAVVISKARQLELLETLDVLARADEGHPLIFLDRKPKGEALCLAFDVLDTDLPFRNSFPILLRNAISYFSSQRDRWVRPHYAIGEVIESQMPIPSEIEDVTLSGLDGDGQTIDFIPVSDQSFWFDQTNRPGVLRFEIGSEFAYCAVNLTDENESNIAPTRSGQSAQDRLLMSKQIAGVIPWLAFAVLGVLLISTEWFTYHFRWTE